MSIFIKSRAVVAALAVSVTATLPAAAADMTLRGASLFDENHAYTKTLMKFGELVNEYSGQDIEFDLRLNSELGIEPDYVNFLTQGVAIDYAIIAPSNLARFADALPLMDMPFAFRDLDHWNAVLSSDVFAPLEEELREKADLVIVGYAGGGTRNLISNKKISNMAELEGHKMRVMGAPIQAKVFDAISAAPSAIAYSEVYNAIQTGVVDGLENESASLAQYKFYEVAPHVTLTKHSITVRPIVFSGKSFDKLSPELQEAVMKAGKEAGAFGREFEAAQDAEKLAEMKEAGNIEVHEFEGREKLLELVVPVQDAYAAELGAQDLLDAVRAK
ncbi:tripartite ATP-independent transporter DctP family solute receptor [Aliiruegeria haliotis]|uniref:Tripartite ATP-independent transporter DctP family solute receptor n=1 Tax=Aliiruegeria haliotis TaxID=1280846 RepID=A0A2T0RZE2_9RHOB|nr:TRAP transporter substrate-binding protein [Aliiruegeria haliotis]PRY26545.1 tripartite ATP-independent transporter DctP family solute receptor [Aliiruegeria haliotis]